MDNSLHIARWVVPVIVGLVLFLPLGCVSWVGLCPADAPGCSSETVIRCHSLVGVPTSGLVALVGVPVVVLVTTAARKLVEERRTSRSGGGVTS